MPAPFGVLSPGEVGEQQPGILDKLVAGIINGTVQIPKHVIDAAAQSAPPGLRRENFTDAPAPMGLTAAWQPGDEMRGAALEAAMLPMGTGAIAGVPMRAGEAVLGAGAVRKTALPMDESSRMARAAEQGFEGPWYHGGLRMDRFTESGKINPRRATSGPMPYFTDNPEMASSYAMGKKPDTSLVDNGNVAEYFTVAPKDLGMSGRAPLTVEQSWHFLPQEVRRDILGKMKRVGYQNKEMGEGPFVLHPEGTNGSIAGDDHWNHVLTREARNNPLTALRDVWHDSGALVDDPAQLSEIFRLAGYPAQISEKTAPWTEARGVFPARLRMTNPLNTSNAEHLRDRVLPALEDAFKSDRSRKAEYGADMWDKNSRYTPREWVRQAKEDLAKGENSYVWTSIPDKVTAELRRLGYDGIVDTGGKMGGQGHTVAIPFGPEQVRSQFAKFDPRNLGKSDLLGALAGAAPVGLLASMLSRKDGA
jgi:hypothetical protein